MSPQTLVKLSDSVLVLDYAFNIVSCSKNTMNFLTLNGGTDFDILQKVLQEGWEAGNSKVTSIRGIYNAYMIKIPEYFIVVFRPLLNQLSSGTENSDYQYPGLPLPRQQTHCYSPIPRFMSSNYRNRRLSKQKPHTLFLDDTKPMTSNTPESSTEFNASVQNEKMEFLLEKYLNQYHTT